MPIRITKALLSYTFLSLLLDSSQAIAGPFCLVTNAGKQCNFLDIVDCQQVAARVKGTCVANSEEVQAPSGSGPFCLVMNGRTECNFLDAVD